MLCVLLVAETAFVHACFSNWPLRSFSAASLALLGGQVALGSRAAAGASTTPMSAQAINTTFLVLGVGGLGLMGRVWLDAAFVL